ncbi:MAG: two pore domain potassium channel family protein [Flavobacteriaceae bacterium]|nr:two pore domain potassium channel family protein [Flavobacteriaceae bacterium]
MTTFFINFYRLFKVIVKGLKTDEEFRFLFIFLNVLLVGATVFYTQTEHWSVIDSLYFSVMTMSTIGYGDLVPTTDLSKLFTIIYSCLSIGTFVSFTAKTVQIIFQNHKDKKEKIRNKSKNDDIRS